MDAMHLTGQLKALQETLTPSFTIVMLHPTTHPNGLSFRLSIKIKTRAIQPGLQMALGRLRVFLTAFQLVLHRVIHRLST